MNILIIDDRFIYIYVLTVNIPHMLSLNCQLTHSNFLFLYLFDSLHTRLEKNFASSRYVLLDKIC